MLDDVGQAYDLALGEEGRIATTLGRHSNDFMTSFYANTPSGFFVEYGWGGRSIDPATLDARRDDVRAEPVGARSELAVAGRARAGARPAAARGRGRPARTGASRRGQLHARARHLSLVGRGAQIRLESQMTTPAAADAPLNITEIVDNSQVAVVSDRHLRAVRPLPDHGRLRRPGLGLRGAVALRRVGHGQRRRPRRQLHADGRADRLAALQHAGRQDRPPPRAASARRSIFPC